MTRNPHNLIEHLMCFYWAWCRGNPKNLRRVLNPNSFEVDR